MAKKRCSQAEIKRFKQLQKHPFLDRRVLDFINAKDFEKRQELEKAR